MRAAPMLHGLRGFSSLGSQQLLFTRGAQCYRVACLGIRMARLS